ncbi:MAG: histidine phosphatase family protein [bacterium]|nr:histidine phosphatase family protein [bacterium]MCP5070458.1 histidine phosphatase family protein [bacterium]
MTVTLPDTKRLLVWRHAKARAAEPHQSDAERPLAPVGAQAAAWMAETFLADPPDLVLCSPAVRARQTLDAAEAIWAGAAPVRVEPDLYLAEPRELLERIGRIGVETGSVLVVGHQPGLGELVSLLAEDGDPAALTTFARGFKTAALAELRLDIRSWREAAPRCAFLAAFSRPALP